MGDLAGLRGLYLTDLRQTRLETALHLAERVGPDDPARAPASAPGQPPALHHGGVEICLVAPTCRLCGGCEWLRGGEGSGRGGVAAGPGIRRADADVVLGGRRADRDRDPGR